MSIIELKNKIAELDRRNNLTVWSMLDTDMRIKQIQADTAAIALATVNPDLNRRLPVRIN